MNWLNKLERKIGRYAVPNLIIWLIGAYTVGYVFGTVSPGILSYLTWTDLETGNMGIYANRVKPDLLIDHGIILLSAWYGT